MQLLKRVLLPFLWGKRTFSVPSYVKVKGKEDSGPSRKVKGKRTAQEILECFQTRLKK